MTTKPDTSPLLPKGGEVSSDPQRAARPVFEVIRGGNAGKLAHRPVPPIQKPRTGRPHMTQEEYVRLRTQLRRTSRNPLRDELLVEMTWLHFLRISEAVSLRWSDVMLDAAEVFIRRAKGSRSGMQRLTGDEVRKLRRLQRDSDGRTAFVFTSERGGPMATDTARGIITTAATAAGLPVANPHSLRHGAAIEAARRGLTPYELQQLLGHRSLKTTTEYLRELSAILPPTIE